MQNLHQLVPLNDFSASIVLKSIYTISSTLPAKLCIYSIKRIQHCQQRQKTRQHQVCMAERIQTSVRVRVRILAAVNLKAIRHRRRQRIKSFSNDLVLVPDPVILVLITHENVSQVRSPCHSYRNHTSDFSNANHRSLAGSQGSQSSLNNSPKRSQQPLKEDESAENQSTFEPLVNLKR